MVEARRTRRRLTTPARPPIGTYVYCVVAAARAPAPPRSRRGLPGAGPVRLVALAEPAATDGGARRSASRGPARALRTWLVVADVPLRLYGEAAINQRLSDLDWVSRAAVAHEAVVESFIEQPAVLPMKLFTIFTDDRRALEHVSDERRRIAAVIGRVEGHHEWGIRLALEDRAARRSTPPAKAGSRAAPVTGAAYLSAKKAHRDQASEMAGRARDMVANVFDRLDRIATESTRRPVSEVSAAGGALLLDAAFLVSRGRERRFTVAVSHEATALAAAGYRLTMSGPWPPYSFIDRP